MAYFYHVYVYFIFFNTSSRTYPLEFRNVDLPIAPDLRTNVSLLEKGVATKDARMISRVLRSSHGLRRRVTVDILRSVVEQSFPPESTEKSALLKFMDAIPVRV